MLAKFSGLNSKGPYLRLEKQKENFGVVLTYSINRRPGESNYEVSCRSSATTAKKCTKKRNARAKLFFCQSKPITFLLLQKIPIVVTLLLSVDIINKTN